VSLLRADARHLPLRDGCVQCVVTSPPYWGLRDYGTAGQIGLEPTPDAYVAEMVSVFREVRRVLRDDGVLFLNIGDSYNAYNGGAGPSSSLSRGAQTRERPQLPTGYRLKYKGLKPKDLVGIPWRVAFALQHDGWYLRSDIIWHKPNPMPESVTDRPTKAHEYVFLLTKGERYAYDAKAISEPSVIGAGAVRNITPRNKGADASRMDGDRFGVVNDGTRNIRTVWTIATQPYSGAHFATMPEALAERCILAGSKPGDLVLDPFGGSGTTARVAISLGRRAVSTDLNPAYLSLARERTHVTYGLPLEFEVPA